MFKIVLVIVIILIFLLLLTITWIYINKYRHIRKYRYTQTKIIEAHTLNLSKWSGGKVKIGVLGDSWPSYGIISGFLCEQLKNYNIDADITYQSYSGFTSGEIRKAIMAGNPAFTQDGVAIDNKTDILIFIAGVNDTCRHIGKDYYIYNSLKLTELANIMGCYVIILEIPPYRIYNKQKFLSEAKHGLFRFVFDFGKRDVIAKYRKALKIEALNTSLQLTILPFQLWDNAYDNKEFYKDAYHLTPQGKNKLAKRLACSVADILKEHTINNQKFQSQNAK